MTAGEQVDYYQGQVVERSKGARGAADRGLGRAALALRSVGPERIDRNG